MKSNNLINIDHVYNVYRPFLSGQRCLHTTHDMNANEKVTSGKKNLIKMKLSLEVTPHLDQKVKHGGCCVSDNRHPQHDGEWRAFQ